MTELGRGALSKMKVRLGDPVQYSFRLGKTEIPVNPLIGEKIRLEYLGDIHCIHCGRKTKKSFSQGYCYPCFTKLAQCDSCMMSPEKCHFEHGTCREPEWGESFCMTPHIVYLANSSGLKVGITRANQIPTRWIDQGAHQALAILRVATRQQSGLVEALFRSQVGDRTNWRAMLKGEAQQEDLIALRDRILDACAEGMQTLQERFGLQAIQPIVDMEPLQIHYPVTVYPTKIVSHDLEKTPIVEGTLLGIKGQYLMFDTGVINIRKYTAYQLAVHH
ncbi:hypothetical protein GCM10009425_12590 [Pseudomonas asuensis]|uniref:DUF2797 domain-containing protein n=1 Tax=Pseudomonas asuensis TaxID=1825787 RepID=A0ABQ2GLZ8_9PSED|nr:DUF2797 domain-containing protein [Pseudomonas asuensis]GGM02743.1 hypothetical protein GCM10009425_12590 [Pseudomonas asuensis]